MNDEYFYGDKELAITILGYRIVLFRWVGKVKTINSKMKRIL